MLERVASRHSRQLVDTDLPPILTACILVVDMRAGALELSLKGTFVICGLTRS